METRATSTIEELRAWLDDNWDPDLTVGQWWDRLGVSGWAAPFLPAGAYGRDASRSDAVVIQREIAAYGAVGPPSGLGLLLAAPTIATHGTEQQIERYVKAIVTGRQAWCQLFSEPGAGSDLAGLTARAERDGDEWVVNGQKVWTSLGQTADLGMLLARTDPDAPKHRGITWFACGMHLPGVEVRPLREMTGHELFNEVFLTDVRVPADAVIGGVNEGWAVANTTLAHERAGLGAGGGGAAGSRVQPGSVAAQLDRRVGDFVDERTIARAKAAEEAEGREDGRDKAPSAAAMLIGFAQGNGMAKDPCIRQDLAQLHILGELGRLNNERLKAARASGSDVPGLPNIAKLAMSTIVRLQRDLGLQIAGPQGTLHAYDAGERAALDAATGNPFLSMVTLPALYAQAPPIYGGTDQIQRNILGERVLGLPKDPGNDSSLPFSSLPKNG